MSSAPTSPAFRCSSRRSGPSFSRMPASSPPVRPRRSTCSSPGGSASTPSANRCRSWAADDSPDASATSRWAPCRSSPSVAPASKRRWRIPCCASRASSLRDRASASSPCSAWRPRKPETGTACTAWTDASAFGTRGRSTGGARPRQARVPAATPRRTARAWDTRPAPGATSLGFDLTTNPSAPLSLDLRADVGGFYNGTRRGGSVTLAARHASSLTTSLRVEYNDVRLDQGNFVRTLIATRVAYFFTPRVLLQTLVQYSNQAQTWTANARFGWLGTAGNGLFVVFNEGREAEGFFQWNRPQARSLIVKYTRQFGRSG